MDDKEDKKKSEFGDQRIITLECDKRFYMFENYLNADDNSYETPDHILETKLGENLQKIQALEGVLLLTTDEGMKANLKAKVEAYKDCSESLIAVGQKINQFNIKMEKTS